MQCVEAGLVNGKKIHLDSSLVDANAAKDSVIKSSPELVAALKKAYGAQESKLENTSTPDGYEAINDRMVSTTDPDAPVVRKSGDSARPRYQHHRAVDDANAVITAVETTPGTIAENKKLMDLVDEHGKPGAFTGRLGNTPDRSDPNRPERVAFVGIVCRSNQLPPEH